MCSTRRNRVARALGRSSRSMLRFVATEKPEGARDSRPVMGHTCSLANPRSCALSEATNSPPYVARCGGVLGRRRALQTRLHRGPFDEKRRAWQPATVVVVARSSPKQNFDVSERSERAFRSSRRRLRRSLIGVELRRTSSSGAQPTMFQ